MLPRLPHTLPILGILLALLLHLHAADLYSAATSLDPLHGGYHHLHNYWCDLYVPITYTGQPNPGRPFALAATLTLILTLFFFWFSVSTLFTQLTLLRRITRIAGTIAAAAAALIFTPLHNVVIVLAAPLGFAAILATCIGLARSRHRLLLALGLLAITVSLADYLLWIFALLEPQQPLIQKSAFALLFLWVLATSLKVLSLPQIPTPLPTTTDSPRALIPFPNHPPRYNPSMGLTIHYTLHAPAVKTATQAKRLVASLRKFAQTLPVSRCSELIEWTRKSGNPDTAMIHSYYLPIGDPADASSYLPIEPLELKKISLNHPGSETACFGLARYPLTASDPDRGSKKIPTRLDGWRWQCFCKTQYASQSQYGGWENFFVIHDSICKLLDEAIQLGLHVEVKDDCHYWDNRDIPQLRTQIESWNSMVAAVVGQYKDAAARHGTPIIAPITQDPDFERLEAKGQHFLQQTPDIHIIRRPKRPRRKPPTDN